MTNASDDKRDFFISFNQHDRVWAKWIAWVLEEAGYSVFFQDWDVCRNFVEYMDAAHRKSAWTIAVLSNNYFGSKFTRLEWSARVAREPEQLIPVRVGALAETHILDAMLYADLTGCDEAEAEQRLLRHIRKWIDRIRSKPATRPSYPAVIPAREVPEKPRFPLIRVNLPFFKEQVNFKKLDIEHKATYLLFFITEIIQLRHDGMEPRIIVDRLQDQGVALDWHEKDSFMQRIIYFFT